MDKLTPQQELFCKLYTTKGDTFSNGTLSYAQAYDFQLERDDRDNIIVDSKSYNTCKASASRLLINDNVRLQVQKNLLALWNDNVVDERLTEILLSGQEANSIQAAKIFNDLKQRITKKLDITSGGRPLAGASDEDLEKLANG